MMRLVGGWWLLSIWIAAAGCGNAREYDSRTRGESGATGEEDGTAGREGGGGANGDDPSALGGAGGDSGAVQPLTIRSEGLPDATVGKLYHHALVADGGRGQRTWKLVAGQLPSGLTLDAAGTLAGEPEEDGDFTFEVEVTDETGAAAVIDLDLIVTMKRWLVYVSDEAVVGQDRLYAVDLQSGYAKINLTPDLLLEEGAQLGEWSPDGAFFAFLVSSPSGVKELRIVEMRRETPGQPRTLDTGVTVGPSDIAWAPDGKRLAYLTQTPAKTFELKYVDVSAEVTVPVTVGPAERYAWSWVGSRFLATRDPNGVSFYRRDGETWGAPRALPIVTDSASPSRKGTFRHVDATQELAWFGESHDDCTGQLALIDFAGPSFEVTALDLSPNHDMSQFAGYDSVSGELLVLEGDNLGSQQGAIDLGKTADCEIHVWAPQSSTLATVNLDHRVMISHLKNGVTESTVVDGAYAAADRLRFADDGSLLAFASGEDVFMTSIEEGRPGKAIRVNASLPSGAAVAEYAVAPDGQGVAYTADHDTAGTIEAFLATRSGNARKISPSLPTDGWVSGLSWAPDGSKLVFEARAASSAPGRLYVVDVTAGGKALDLTPGLGCVDEVCENVGTPLFQP